MDRDESNKLEDLRAGEQRERTALDGALAVHAAEDVVVDARFAELDAAHKSALRRLAAAKGLLTKARKDGSAEKIATARARVDAAHAECDRLGRANIAEMTELIAGRNRTFRELMAQMDRTWNAATAVTDALGHPFRDHRP